MYTSKLLSKTTFASLIFLLILSSCKKQDIQPQANQNLLISGDDEVSLVRESTNMKLTLRPGPATGQDVYVDKEKWLQSSNLNYVNELSIVYWTIDGNYYHSKTYIRFDSPLKIPASSTIARAKLYLYGLSSS